MALSKMARSVLWLVFLGCADGGSPTSLDDNTHGHYHVHAADVSHEHEHPDAEKGGHAHRHGHGDHKE